MKLQIFMCLLAATAAQDEVHQNQESAEDAEYSCIRMYRKGDNLTSKCEHIMALVEKDRISNLNLKIKSNETMNCVVEKFREYKVWDFILYNIYEKHPEEFSFLYFGLGKIVGSSLKTICERSQDVDNRLKEFMVNISSIRDKATKEERQPAQCLYKFFVGRKIIDAADFGFDTPDINSTICSQYSELFESILKKPREPGLGRQPTTHFYQCVNRKQGESSDDLDLAVIMTIATFDLSELQKEKIKAKMLSVWSSDEYINLECARDVYRGKA